MKVLFVLALALSAALPLTAHALTVSLVGAGGWSKPQTDPETSYTAKASPGFGALAEFSLVPTLGLELGALSLPRQYEAAGVTYRQNQVMVPVVLRAHLLNVISLGVGGYYSDFTGGGNVNYASSALTRSDYGVVTSMALYYSLSPGARILIDGRYLIGIKDNDETYFERKFRDVQVLAGVQFGF